MHWTSMDAMQPSARFAKQLRARYARRQPWTVPTPSVLRRRAPWLHQTTVRHDGARITVAPTLALTLRDDRRADSPATTLAATVASRHGRQDGAPSWVDRVSARHRRDEGGSTATRPSAPGVDSVVVRTPSSVVPPTPRVLRRQSGPAARNHDVVADRDHTPRARPAPAPVQAPKAVPLTTVEMSRLTDHVMQTLDRRLASFRDRHGRR